VHVADGPAQGFGQAYREVAESAQPDAAAEADDSRLARAAGLRHFGQRGPGSLPRMLDDPPGNALLGAAHLRRQLLDFVQHVVKLQKK
jgi:hypothetical protein